jgi:hypothetical protein
MEYGNHNKITLKKNTCCSLKTIKKKSLDPKIPLGNLISLIHIANFSKYFFIFE